MGGSDGGELYGTSVALRAFQSFRQVGPVFVVNSHTMDTTGLLCRTSLYIIK